MDRGRESFHKERKLRWSWEVINYIALKEPKGFFICFDSLPDYCSECYNVLNRCFKATKNIATKYQAVFV